MEAFESRATWFVASSFVIQALFTTQVFRYFYVLCKYVQIPFQLSFTRVVVFLLILTTEGGAAQKTQRGNIFVSD